jgi:hypothetical protein
MHGELINHVSNEYQTDNKDRKCIEEKTTVFILEVSEREA